MDLIHRSPASAGVRGLAVAWLAALVLALTAVGPSLGAAPSPIRLSLPSVSDRSTALGEAVTFRIEYRHRGGLDPASVVVRVGPASFAMRAVNGDGNVRRGVTYETTASPPAGKLDVRFEAVDPEGAVGTLDDGWITVTAPPPPPPASPPPAAPDPTQPPAPPAAAPPADGPGSTGGPGDGSGDPGPGTGDPPSAADGLEDPGPPADRFGEIRDPGAPAGVLAPTGIRGTGRGGTPSVGTPGAMPSAATAGDPRPIPSRLVPDPSAALAAGAIPGLSGTILAADPVATMVVSTVGGAAMVTAFLLFGRRRPEDDEMPDGRSAAASADAALASGAMAVGAWASQPPAGPAGDPEAAIPRWRRPSLLEARKHDPARAPEPEPAPRMTFAAAAALPVDDDLERRRIRYRVVRLLDSPDELTANEIGLLDEGDEVALCERSGSYWLVLCPDGSRGWVHRMVLGAPTGTDAEERRPTDDEVMEPGLAARFTAARPMPTWTYDVPTTDAGGADPARIDADVLAAYRAARARA